MSKYAIARDAIDRALQAGREAGHAEADVLLALLVSCIQAYKDEVGREATRDALLYELGEVDGTIDTHFLRAR